MSFQDHDKTIENIVEKEYEFGFKTDIDTEKFPKGLNEDIVRRISAKKNEPDYMLEFRLKAFEHWKKMEEPHWLCVIIHQLIIKMLIIMQHLNQWKKNLKVLMISIRT